MAEAVSLHMIIGNFYHQFRPEWLPGQVFALAPAALPAGHSTGGFLACAHKRLLRPARAAVVPRQVRSLTPTALTAWYPTGGFLGRAFRVCPILPRMRKERVLAIRVEDFCKLLSLLGAEARANPNMLQSTGVVASTTFDGF